MSTFILQKEALTTNNLGITIVLRPGTKVENPDGRDTVYKGPERFIIDTLFVENEPEWFLREGTNNNLLPRPTPGQYVSELITQYLLVCLDLANQPKYLEQPPFRPAYESIGLYREYKELIEKVKNVNDAILKTHESILEKKEKFKNLIFQQTPVAHVWFMTEDKAYAYAMQCTDWPNDPPQLLIEVNPVLEKLRPLKLQHIN